MTKYVKRVARIAPSLTVAAVALTALLQFGQSRPMPDAGKFWSTFALIGADEAESYEQLEAMRDAADRVVQARMVKVGISRVIQGDAPEDRTVLVKGEFVSERNIAGHKGEKFSVEFLLPQCAKDDRTGKSDVLRTWNPEPGVPVEMS